jgi:cation:H+ antiporter
VLIEVLLAIAGLVVLAVAADQLVLGSSRLAARSGLSRVVIGVVVIGLGTSAPEFLVSGVAAARGDTGIAIGNLVGSNIINVTHILGSAALIAKIRVQTGVVRREVPLAVGAVAVFAVLAWRGLDPASAAALVVLLVGAILLLVRWSTGGRPDPAALPALPVVTHRWWPEGIRAIAGLVGVLAGAQVLVINAATIANRLAVPQVVIGFTVVALGTSLPELVTSIQAQRRGEADLVVGNLFGSNLFNSLAGGAIIGLAPGSHPILRTQPVAIIVMVLVTVLAWTLLRRGLHLNRIEGLLLITVYLVSLPLVLAA